LASFTQCFENGGQDVAKIWFAAQADSVELLLTQFPERLQASISNLMSHDRERR
jgi:hypothetical protein